ncbi:MAG: homocysteine S-methyltransferase family protein, partial [Bdellovibrionota bacterium]
MKRPSVKSAQYHLFEKALKEKILVLDGAMGTMIQQYKLGEADFRNAALKSHSKDLKGNNELLVLSRPDVVEEIHLKYLEAGAHIIETNTFNANRISQEDYKLSHIVKELNVEAAKVAIRAAEKFKKKNPGVTVFVAGAIGPTNRTASLSPDINNPGIRNVTFDQLVEAYEEQTEALLEGGVDLLLPETSFDTLNMKACLFAIENVEERRGERLPVLVSATITDQSGRVLSGQTAEAFWNSIRGFKPLAVGLNCALGAAEMRPHIQTLSKIADTYILCYPNAGLPNPLSPTGYDQTPESLAWELEALAEGSYVNIVGGCCGTTPPHIKAVAKIVSGFKPRVVPVIAPQTRLSGLEPLNTTAAGERPFLMVGERTNVTGSPKFAKLVREGKLQDALTVARQQVESGANILDVNFDEGMLDGKEFMKNFLLMLATEPDIARIPIMIDSSKWEIIEEGLKCLQGKCIVNSVSLKEGEALFLEHARKAQKYGAAIVIMAFDEQGQATSVEEKVRICTRAYRLLVDELDFDPCDIIFDPNILTVATGMDEHNRYALNFIEALPLVKQACPGALTSGGVSNLSFSFRGNNKVREAMHTVFLYHAIRAGLDMGIVNAGMLEVYEDIDPELRELCEDVIWNKNPDASEKLIDYAEKIKNSGEKEVVVNGREAWRNGTLQERMTHSLVKGIDQYIVEDTTEA